MSASTQGDKCCKQCSTATNIHQTTCCVAEPSHSIQGPNQVKTDKPLPRHLISSGRVGGASGSGIARNRTRAATRASPLVHAQLCSASKWLEHPIA